MSLVYFKRPWSVLLSSPWKTPSLSRVSLCLVMWSILDSDLWSHLPWADTHCPCKLKHRGIRFPLHKGLIVASQLGVKGASACLVCVVLRSSPEQTDPAQALFADGINAGDRPFLLSLIPTVRFQTPATPWPTQLTKLYSTLVSFTLSSVDVRGHCHTKIIWKLHKFKYTLILLMHSFFNEQQLDTPKYFLFYFILFLNWFYIKLFNELNNVFYLWVELICLAL